MAVRKRMVLMPLRAFREIRTSPEMNDALQGVVDDILADVGGTATESFHITAGEGATTSKSYEDYAGGVDPGRRRSRGYVVTTSWKAMRDEAKNHTLLRALAKKAGSL